MTKRILTAAAATLAAIAGAAALTVTAGATVTGPNADPVLPTGRAVDVVFHDAHVPPAGVEFIDTLPATTALVNGEGYVVELPGGRYLLAQATPTGVRYLNPRDVR